LAPQTNFELILVRWLSGRKQRFAKAPYPKRVPRVRIPPSPLPLEGGLKLGFLQQILQQVIIVSSVCSRD
jgi:hypothetical protein